MFFRVVYKSGQIFLPFCQNTRVWQTDGQTDRNLITIPCLHYMQRGKNVVIRTAFWFIVCVLALRFRPNWGSFSPFTTVRGFPGVVKREWKEVREGSRPTFLNVSTFLNVFVLEPVCVQMWTVCALVNSRVRLRDVRWVSRTSFATS